MRRLIPLILILSCAGPVENGISPVAGCTSDSACPSGYFCVSGACQQLPGSCTSDSDCTAPDTCQDNSCLPPLAGSGGDGGTGTDGGTDGGTSLSFSNGDFESGSLTGWNATGTANVTSSAHSGSYAAQLSSGAVLTQSFTLSGNTFLFWYRTTCTTGGAAQIEIYDSNGGLLATPLQAACAASWTQGSFDVSALSGKEVVLSLEAHGSAATFDDLSFSNGGTPDFSLSATPGTASDGPNQSATISVAISASGGFAGAVALTVSGAPSGATATLASSTLQGASSTTLTLNAGTATAGSYTITLSGTSGALHHAATIAWTITQGQAAADFSLGLTAATVSAAQGGSGSTTISVTGSNGFAGTVALSVSGAPTGASASCSPTSVASGATSMLSISAGSAPVGTYSLVVTGTSGSLTHTATVSLTVTAAPDFSLSASPTAVSGSGSSTVSVVAKNGFSATVALSVSGAPTGATAVLGASTTTTSTSLTLTAGTGAAGTYNITVTGRANGVSRTSTVSWTIASATCTADTWGNWAHGFFTTNCTGCHSQFNTFSSVNSDKSNIQSDISNNSMPRGATLSSSDKTRILKWLSCGLPQ